ncbi:winged helix DNA-binding domain-containing protein [Cellulomonas aerilata]|uniref:Winged helix DNA-binding domain-containing protein n=1 Tax=Cellulomonas aerilata TaxID=515326 RepID=A0A512D9H7_9CELL|nr:winged helix DNA-binding domain-containing protein [Cellulomonas aerilata]GEO33119.1 hypothetical protein CAE01nite_08440 [Cellulomonas aerilata]
MRLTAGGLNRATLARQLLLRREPLDVAEAVRRVVAIQAQHPASPYVALWNRVEPFDPAQLDRAFADALVVKASLMRITLHAVHAEDHNMLHTAMQPTLRGSRLVAARFRAGGLDPAEVEALVPGVARFAREPRTNPELRAWVGRHVNGDGEAAWWALRCFAPLRHAPTGGPWSFGPRPSYLAAGTPRAPDAPGTPEAALPTLVRRYLEGFGPASAADVARFTLLPRTGLRAALAAMSGELVELRAPDGTTLYDVPGGPLPDEDTPAPPRLMAMWDSVLLAYAGSGRVVPEPYRRLVTRSNGDVLPTLLVDGRVAGVWRPVDGGVEAAAFHPLPDDAWAGLAAEARALVPLLAAREPRAYRRYDRWWADLPAAATRVLTG